MWRTAAGPVIGIPVRRIVIAGRARHAETTGMRGRVERRSRLVALANLGASGGVHACSREHRQPLRRNGAALRPASLGGRAWRGRDTRDYDGTVDRGAGTHATLRQLEGGVINVEPTGCRTQRRAGGCDAARPDECPRQPRVARRTAVHTSAVCIWSARTRGGHTESPHAAATPMMVRA